MRVQRNNEYIKKKTQKSLQCYPKVNIHFILLFSFCKEIPFATFKERNGTRRRVREFHLLRNYFSPLGASLTTSPAPFTHELWFHFYKNPREGCTHTCPSCLITEDSGMSCSWREGIGEKANSTVRNAKLNSLFTVIKTISWHPLPRPDVREVTP